MKYLYEDSNTTCGHLGYRHSLGTVNNGDNKAQKVLGVTRIRRHNRYLMTELQMKSKCKVPDGPGPYKFDPEVVAEPS